MSNVNLPERTDYLPPQPDTDFPGVGLVHPLSINVDGTGGTIKGKTVLTL